MNVLYEFRGLASDNIRRLSLGNEVSGYLYGVSAGLEFKGQKERENYLVGGMYGLEKLVDDDQETTNTYRVYGDFNATSTGGFFVRMNGLASREVGLLDYSDLDQRRSLQERIFAVGELGRKLESGSQWSGSVFGSRLDSQDKTRVTAGFSGDGDLAITRLTTLHGNASYQKGVSWTTEDEWSESEITLGMSRRKTRNLTLGGHVFLYSSDSYFPQSDSTINWDHVRLAGSQESFLSRDVKFDASIGYESVKSSEFDWDGDFYADFALSAPLVTSVTALGKVAEFKANASYGVEKSTLSESTPIFNRTGQIGANVTWRPGRRTEINTGFSFAQRFFPGFGNQVETEETLASVNLEFLWLFTPNTRLKIEAVADRRDHDLDQLDMEENQVGMIVSGYF